ncbi:IS3 family transposase [Succinimonas amylolytica]|uniref:IS3 family transposase n=1 Tax=Succinimonas amylolytica TaxID=83769 RepID=UPI0009FC1B35
MGDLSLDELKMYLDRYIQWYNNVRIKNTLGGLSLVKYRLKPELAITVPDIVRLLHGNSTILQYNL